jgi:hypothetical protein
MRRAIFTTITAATIVGSTVLATIYCSHVSASGSNLKQQILPLNCVFQTIDTGNGVVIQYLTPTECGQIITPPTPTPQTDTGGSSITPEPTTSSDSPLQPSSVVLGQPTILFPSSNEKSAASTVRGFTRTIKLGVSYRYTLHNDSKHSITLLQVGNSSARILFASTPQYITLFLGRTTPIDLDADGKNDINARLDRIISQNEVEFSIWLLSDSKPTPTNSKQSSHSRSPASTLILLSIFIVLCATLVLPLTLRRLRSFPKR